MNVIGHYCLREHVNGVSGSSVENAAGDDRDIIVAHDSLASPCMPCDVRKQAEPAMPGLSHRSSGWTDPGPMARGSRHPTSGWTTPGTWPWVLHMRHPGRPTSGPLPGAPLPAQLLHQLLHLRCRITAADQEGEQAALAHGDRKAVQLACPLHRHGARLEVRIDALLVERPPHRVLGRAALHALREQIPNQAGRSPTADRAHRGIPLSEPAVVEQP